jgi:DNA polymerase
MGLKRNEVHICSVVGSEEGYLFQDQIERIQPEVVVALGVEAHNMLVGSGSKDSAGNIASVRGEWLSFQGVALMPTFNPTYLLTNPAAKREFWLDLQQVMKKLGLEKPV